MLVKKKKNPKSWVWSSFLKGLPFWKGFLSETALPDVFPIHNDWYILLVAQDKKLWIHSWLFFQTLPHYLSAIPAAAAAKLCQLCPTLWDPTDGSPPGSRPWDSPGNNTGVGCHFLLQYMKVKSESEVAQSCVQLFATPWTVAYQAPPPMGFPRQEYWSGLPLPSPELAPSALLITYIPPQNTDIHWSTPSMSIF